MNTLSNSETKTEFSIHPATLIGHVSLTVANLRIRLRLPAGAWFPTALA